MRRRIRPLGRDARGAVAVEFALWTTMFFVVMIAALDIGMYVIQRGRLGEALEGAALAAFKSRDSVTYSNIPAFVRQGSSAPTGTTVTVTTGCNGGNGNCVNTSGGAQRTCGCLSATGTYTAAGSCGAACGGTAGSVSGYYLTIDASYPYRPVVLPNGVLRDGLIQQSVTVRLQ